jgi:LPXTG-site transpeptidase (sortase) family protein
MKAQTRALWWLEAMLLAVGVVLAAWCAKVIIEARYYNTLPIPAATDATPATPAGPDATPSPSTPSRMPIAPGAWVARFDAPSVHLSATVLEGTDDATLARAAGHIEDTALPGTPGNFGIAGHRDTTFRAVRRLHLGDPLTITTADHLYRYRITKTMIVNPKDVYVLDNADHPTLTLVTCYPFEFVGHAPHRFIVSADLVAETATGAGGGGEAGSAGSAGKAGGTGKAGRPGLSDIARREPGK